MRKLWMLALVALLTIGGATAAFAQEEDSGAEEDAAEKRPHPARLRVLHGEGVATNADGEFIDVAHQKGEVAAVSESSITVTSADDYEQTYAIDEDTKVRKGRDEIEPTELAEGDEVMVFAEVDGDDYTARRIGSRGEDGEDRPMRGRIGAHLRGHFGG